MFPRSCPRSIVGAETFHFRVRDGNGWVHLALATKVTRNHEGVRGQGSEVKERRCVPALDLSPVTSDLDIDAILPARREPRQR